MKILREHWEQTKRDNQNQLLNSKITEEMSKEIIKLCDRMIATFPAPKVLHTTQENLQNQKNLKNRKI